MSSVPTLCSVAAIVITSTAQILKYIFLKHPGFKYDRILGMAYGLVTAVAAALACTFSFGTLTCDERATDHEVGQCELSHLYYWNQSLPFPNKRKMSSTHIIPYYRFVGAYFTAIFVISLAHQTLMLLKWLSFDHSIQKLMCNMKMDQEGTTHFANKLKKAVSGGSNFLFRTFVIIRLISPFFFATQLGIFINLFNLPIGWEIDILLDTWHGTNSRSAHYFPANAVCAFTSGFRGAYIPVNFSCTMSNNVWFSKLSFVVSIILWIGLVVTSVTAIGTIFKWSCCYKSWVRKEIVNNLPDGAHDSEADDIIDKHLGNDGIYILELLRDYRHQESASLVITSFINIIRGPFVAKNPEDPEI